MQATTFADAFGTWWARIEFNTVPTFEERAYMPVLAARSIAREINARQGTQVTPADVDVTLDSAGPGYFIFRESWDTLDA